MSEMWYFSFFFPVRSQWIILGHDWRSGCPHLMGVVRHLLRGRPAHWLTQGRGRPSPRNLLFTGFRNIKGLLICSL